MKNYIFLFFSFITFSLFGQNGIQDPVDWNFTIEHVQDDIYDLVIDVEIDSGWSVYSQHVDPDGPIPTSFSFFESVATCSKIFSRIM